MPSLWLFSLYRSCLYFWLFFHDSWNENIGTESIKMFKAFDTNSLQKDFYQLPFIQLDSERLQSSSVDLS